MSKTGKPKQWTSSDKARIMSTTAKQNGGNIPKEHWATKVQSKVDSRTAPPTLPSKKNS